MTTDRLDARLEELDEACDELRRRIGSVRRAVVAIRRMRAEGHTASDILAMGPGVSARRDLRQSWSQVNEALHLYRVALVKSIVDDEGLSIAEAARRTGNARQVASRLYHHPAG
jgi:hypothetical protein